jgi:hypothetical protein
MPLEKYTLRKYFAEIGELDSFYKEVMPCRKSDITVEKVEELLDKGLLDFNYTIISSTFLRNFDWRKYDRGGSWIEIDDYYSSYFFAYMQDNRLLADISVEKFLKGKGLYETFEDNIIEKAWDAKEAKENIEEANLSPYDKDFNFFYLYDSAIPEYYVKEEDEYWMTIQREYHKTILPQYAFC